MKYPNLQKLNMARPHGLIPRVTCRDGFTLSVQGSRRHYSVPQEDHNCVEKYRSLEVQSSHPVAVLEKYDIQSGRCIYGYVPFELVEALLASHGGIK